MNRTDLDNHITADFQERFEQHKNEKLASLPKYQREPFGNDSPARRVLSLTDQAQDALCDGNAPVALVLVEKAYLELLTHDYTLTPQRQEIRDCLNEVLG